MKRFELIYNGVSSIFNAPKVVMAIQASTTRFFRIGLCILCAQAKQTRSAFPNLLNNTTKMVLLSILSMQERALNLVLRLSLKS